MSTIISTAIARTEQEEDLAALSARWPQFSAPELCRLRFLAYRRATERLRPARPLSPTGARVCAEIAAYLRAPAPPPSCQSWGGTTPGVLPLWRAWMADHGSAHHMHRLWEASA